MLCQNNLIKIKKQVEKFFQKITYNPRIEISSEKDTILINVQMQNPQILIGEGGQTLLEIQHLLRIILIKEMKEVFYIDLDINDYKKKKNQHLKEIARTIADEVALTKGEKYLPSMPAYERRIVHLEIAKRQDVSTKSIGREPERRILISFLIKE